MLLFQLPIVAQHRIQCPEIFLCALSIIQTLGNVWVHGTTRISFSLNTVGKMEQLWLILQHHNYVSYRSGTESKVHIWRFWQLGRPVPAEVWHATWVTYRSEAENTFLWQLLYRISATNRWQYPDRPASDPVPWCSRCLLNVPDSKMHIIASGIALSPDNAGPGELLFWRGLHMDNTEAAD